MRASADGTGHPPSQRRGAKEGIAMTTLELKLDLPDRLAREAQAAGLLAPEALTQMLKDAMRRRAGQALLAGAARATAAGSKPLSMKEIQEEVKAVRRARKSRTDE
jgi:hypothetical protein